MHIELSEDKQYVVFKTSDIKEIGYLKKFPGLLRSGDIFYLPNKLNVIHNVFGRLRGRLKKAATISKEVHERRGEKEELLELPSWFKFHTEPLEHQHLALRHLYTRQSLGLLLDPGLGKTKVVLDYIHLCKQEDKSFQKALIVCPKALLFVWEKEARKHRPELRIHCLRSASYSSLIQTRLDKLASPATDFREAKCLKAEIAKLEIQREEENEAISKADVIVVNYSKVSNEPGFFLRNNWSLLAIDEGLVKNPKSAQTEALTKIAAKTPKKIIMSGTLINNSPGDVFAPTRILEPALLGTSFYNFNQFYGIMAGSSTQKFLVGYRERDEIRSCLEAVSVVMRKEEWLKDLPKKKFIKVPVQISEEQADIYQCLASNYIAEFQERDIEVDNPLSCLCKLTQIVNGFLYVGGKDPLIDMGLAEAKAPPKKPEGRRETLFFKEQPKIEAARKLFRNELKGRKVVVWYNMSAEAELLEEMFKEEGIRYVTVKGGEKHTGDNIDQFNDDPEIDAILCQAKAVNYGVTLLGTQIDDADYEPELSLAVYTHLFYSLNYSGEVFIQQQDRSHRIGQKVPPEYYILETDTPIEEAIFTALMLKEKIREEFLVDISKRIRGPK